MFALGLVLARLVLEPNTVAPAIDEDAILMVQRHGAFVGGCPGDGGATDGGMGDAGIDAGDAGPGDGGVGDAGAGDAGVGCETIEGDAVSLIVRPRFSAAPGGAQFALLFVTPSRPIVETTNDPFAELAALTAAPIEIHTVEVPDPAYGSRCEAGGGCGVQSQDSGNNGGDSGGGCGVGSPSFDPPDFGDGGLGDGPALEVVGPYQIVRAQPADGPALAALLDSFGYVYEQADLDAVAPYLARGFTVVAVRVAIHDQPSGQLSPLQLTWAGSELRLPTVGTGTTEGLTVYVAADGRYEFPDAIVPFARFTVGGDTRFLTRNTLAARLSESPDDDPIATPIASNPEQIPDPVIVTKEVRVPVSHYCEDDQPQGCCRDCNARGGAHLDWGILTLGVAIMLRPRRRRFTSRR